MPREMGGEHGGMRRRWCAAMPSSPAAIEKTFGARRPPSDEAVLADIGKALAAFQETLLSGRSPFDDFRDALARGDRAATAHYPVAAQRGLRIFVGRGNCNACHVGPRFQQRRVPRHRRAVLRRRAASIRAATAASASCRPSRLNLLGPLQRRSRSARAPSGTRHVALEHRNFGEFKVPSLRNVARTAPYMHNGSLATLRDVVRHYSEINPDRLHSDGEAILKPLGLTERRSTTSSRFSNRCRTVAAITGGANSPRIAAERWKRGTTLDPRLRGVTS